MEFRFDVTFCSNLDNFWIRPHTMLCGQHMAGGADSPHRAKNYENKTTWATAQWKIKRQML